MKDGIYILRNESTDSYVDIPESKAEEFVGLCLYSDLHGAQNQQWEFRDNQIVSVLNPDLCLGVHTFFPETRHSDVQLLLKDKPGTRWIIRGANICLESRPNLLLSNLDGQLVVRTDSSTALWNIYPTDSSAFLFRNRASGHSVDIYNSVADNFIPVKLYDEANFGDNQLWGYESMQIPSKLNPNLCLGISHLSPETKFQVVLMDRNHDLTTKWVFQGSKIYLEARPDLFLTQEGNDLVATSESHLSYWDVLPSGGSSMIQ